jgi:predicted nucleic acid-binding protein
LQKKKRAADWIKALWRARSLAISPQILNEYYATATGRLQPRLDEAIARRDIHRFLRWPVVTPDRDLYRFAFDAQDRFGFSWWDSFVVAAARRGGCTHLLTEDLQHGQDLDGLVITDPFQTDPATILV